MTVSQPGRFFSPLYSLMWVPIQVKSHNVLSSSARWWWDCGGTTADWLRSAQGWRRESWTRCRCCPWRDCLPLRSMLTRPEPVTRTGGAGPWSWSWERWCCGAFWQTQRPRPASRGWCASDRPGKWSPSGRCLLDSGQTPVRLCFSLNLLRKIKK